VSITQTRAWEWVSCGHTDRETVWFLVLMTVNLIALGLGITGIVMSS
jgi:hypothetical protein